MPGRQFCRLGLAVKASGQDGSHRLVGACIVPERPFSRCLKPLWLVVLPQPDDAQTGAVALLGIGAGCHDFLYQPGGGSPCFACPLDDARQAPPGIFTVLWRHVFFERGMSAADIGTGMGGYPLSPVKDFHSGGSDGPPRCGSRYSLLP